MRNLRACESEKAKGKTLVLGPVSPPGRASLEHEEGLVWEPECKDFARRCDFTFCRMLSSRVT